MGGQITLPDSHLMDPSGHELTQTHEGAWVQRGAMVVVLWRREEKGSFVEEGLRYSFLQG